MNNKVILIALTAVMLSTVSYAQNVIIEDNAVIIDCSKMYPKFYNSIKKVSTTNATNSTAGTNTAGNLSSSVNNAKIYPKFEVSKGNNSTASTWSVAVDLCDKLSYNGSSDWRLPTERELVLIWILKVKLAANGVSFSDATYWSATEYSYIVNSACRVDFSSGDTFNRSKTSNLYVRCIRDISIP